MLASRGQLLLAQDDLNSAQGKYQEALSIANELGDKDDAAAFQVALANIIFEQGDLAGAEAPIRQAIAVFRTEKSIDNEIDAHAVLARALLLAGKTLDAWKEIDSTRSLVYETQNPTNRWDITLVAGRVQSALGKPAVARKTLLVVLNEADKHRFVPYSFEARLALGEIEMRSGNKGDGYARLQALEEDAKARGFLLIARKAATALNGEPAPHAAGALTRRCTDLLDSPGTGCLVRWAKRTLHALAS